MHIAILAAADRAAWLGDTLGAAGFTCRCVGDLTRLFELSPMRNWDMVIAEIATTESAWELEVKALRAHLTPDAPILLVAGAGDQEALLAALEAGADDFLIRPVRRAELLVRTQVLLKRANPDHPALAALRFGRYSFEPRSLRASANGKPVVLTRKEFELALLFFRNLGRPLSRATILDALWPHEAETASRTLDTHVSRVRTKLGLGAQADYRLIPVYSFGYRLESAAELDSSNS